MCCGCNSWGNNGRIGGNGRNGRNGGCGQYNWGNGRNGGCGQYNWGNGRNGGCGQYNWGNGRNGGCDQNNWGNGRNGHNGGFLGNGREAYENYEYNGRGRKNWNCYNNEALFVNEDGEYAQWVEFAYRGSIPVYEIEEQATCRQHGCGNNRY